MLKVDNVTDYATFHVPGYGIPLSLEVSNESRAMRRKLWHKAMGSGALRDFAPIMTSRVQQCFELLKQQAENGNVVNISPLLSYLA